MPVTLKKCPNCGKRFSAEREGEIERKEEEPITVEEPSRSMTGQVPSRYVASAMEPAEEAQPPEEEMIEVEKDTRMETYHCTHCGYTWSEKTIEFEGEGGQRPRADTLVTEGSP